MNKVLLYATTLLTFFSAGHAFGDEIPKLTYSIDVKIWEVSHYNETSPDYTVGGTYISCGCCAGRSTGVMADGVIVNSMGSQTGTATNENDYLSNQALTVLQQDPGTLPALSYLKRALRPIIEENYPILAKIHEKAPLVSIEQVFRVHAIRYTRNVYNSYAHKFFSRTDLFASESVPVSTFIRLTFKDKFEGSSVQMIPISGFDQDGITDWVNGSIHDNPARYDQWASRRERINEYENNRLQKLYDLSNDEAAYVLHNLHQQDLYKGFALLKAPFPVLRACTDDDVETLKSIDDGAIDLTTIADSLNPAVTYMPGFYTSLIINKDPLSTDGKIIYKPSSRVNIYASAMRKIVPIALNGQLEMIEQRTSNSEDLADWFKGARPAK